MLLDKCVCNIYDDVVHCKTLPPNLNFISLCSVWGQNAKFKYCQYFQLYDAVLGVLCVVLGTLGLYTLCSLHYCAWGTYIHQYVVCKTVNKKHTFTIRGSLSTAHSSRRYTATVGAHYQCLQTGWESSTCYNLWRMPRLWLQQASEWWSEAGWHYHHEVGILRWVEHLLYNALYIILGDGKVSIKNVGTFLFVITSQIPNSTNNHGLAFCWTIF